MMTLKIQKMNHKDKAKELAKELVDEFHVLCYREAILLRRETAKQCALICLDRTILLLKDFQEEEHDDKYWYIEAKILDELEVKQETEKL